MRRLIFFCYLFLCFNVATVAQQVSWVVISGGVLSQVSMDCATFADGSILNAGIFQGQTNFYPGDNTPRISWGGYDIFVQKLDTNGITQWVVSFGGKGEERLTGMSIDGDGNILLAGTFTDTCDFNPGSNLDIGISKGQTDMFLLKLDASGNYLWSRRFGGNSNDKINDLAVDADGNIYFGGIFTYTVDFSTDSIPFPQNSFGGASGFVMKLNAQGERQWFRKVGSGGNAAAIQNLAVANGKLYVSGFHSEDSLNFGSPFQPVWAFSSESQQTFFLQLDLNGNALKVDTFRFVVRIEDIHLDTDNNILLTGYYNGNADLNPGPGFFPVVSNDFISDIFILKLDSNSNFLWARTFKSEAIASCFGIKVSSFQQGDILLLAEFQGTVDFDPGLGVVAKSSNGFYDVAVLRLNTSGDFVWVQTFGGAAYDFGTGISIADDIFYVSGSFSSTVDFNPGGAPYLLTANGGDAYLIKFGSYSALSTPESETLQHKIYPNPSTGLIHVEGEYDFVQLLNLQGQLLHKQSATAGQGELDLSWLKDGVYLLHLGEGGKHKYHKLVIRR